MSGGFFPIDFDVIHSGLFSLVGESTFTIRIGGSAKTMVVYPLNNAAVNRDIGHRHIILVKKFCNELVCGSNRIGV